MKLILIILSLCWFQSFATHYYVANAGSNSNNGTSTSTPFQTIAKAISVAISGDEVSFNRGDSWNEKLWDSTVSNLTFDCYGTGANPKFTGFQTLSFTNGGSNIWYTTFSNACPYENTVVINDTLRAKGRYPNGLSYLACTSTAGINRAITSLSGTPNYASGEIVLWSGSYTIDKSYITSQSGDTINYSTPTLYNNTYYTKYFIQNILSVLDLPNEWCIDSTKKISVYETSMPTGKASSIDTLIYLTGGVKSITFDSIDIDGANTCALMMINAHSITFENGNITNCGTNGVYANVNSSNFKFLNNTENNIWSDGIWTDYVGIILAQNDSTTVSNCTISNIGLIPGMAQQLSYHSYIGINICGSYATINNNNIQNIGYVPILFYGDSCLIKNNYINTYCLNKVDGGGIYCFSASPWENKFGTLLKNSGSKIISNIVLNGNGIPAYPNSGISFVHGIYLDGTNAFVTVDSNTCYTSQGFGVFLNEGDSNTVIGNTLINHYVTAVWLQDQSPTPADMYITGNAEYYKYSGTGNTNLMAFQGFVPGVANVGELDSNFYSIPGHEGNAIWVYPNNLSLASFQASYTQEAHSKVTPANITSAAPLIYYDSTSSPRTISLTGTYYSLRGVTYNNSVTVQPFKTEILFKATNDIIANTQLQLNLIGK